MKLTTELKVTATGSIVETKMTNKIDKWTPAQVEFLCEMVEANFSWSAISINLKRKESACKSMYSYAKLRRRIKSLESDLGIMGRAQTQATRIMEAQKEITEMCQEIIESHEETIELLEGNSAMKDQIIADLRGETVA
jgi:hypothetical protein